jgi:hypothetical protein
MLKTCSSILTIILGFTTLIPVQAQGDVTITKLNTAPNVDLQDTPPVLMGDI